MNIHCAYHHTECLSVDVVYDFGCGEGDVVCSIGKTFFENQERCPSKIVGFDILERPLQVARNKWVQLITTYISSQGSSLEVEFLEPSSSRWMSIIKNRTSDKEFLIEFLNFDFIERIDPKCNTTMSSHSKSNWLNEATVIYVYLTPRFLNKKKLVNQLQQWLIDDSR